MADRNYTAYLPPMRDPETFEFTGEYGKRITGDFVPGDTVRIDWPETDDYYPEVMYYAIRTPMDSFTPYRPCISQKRPTIQYAGETLTLYSGIDMRYASAFLTPLHANISTDDIDASKQRFQHESRDPF